MTVSEWADKHRRLSPENSAEAGAYHTTRTPYIVAPSDAFNDPSVKQITVMKSAQTGFTTMLENIIGFTVSVDPCSILILLPTLETAEDFSKARITLMARDTRCLHELAATKTRKANTTILKKSYIGGTLTFAGSNSAASLASKSVRVLLVDEADRCAQHVGMEGNPITIALARTKAFWNRKVVMVSTPTVSGISRIEAEFLASDQNYYWIPCPSCEQLQKLEFGNRGGPFGLQWTKDNPVDAYYQCVHCEYHILSTDKPRFNLMGEWRPNAPFTGNRGFHISELYSPFVSFAEMAKDYEDTQKLPDKLKTFFNLSLGLPWQQQDTPEIAADALELRTEPYTGSSLPDDIVVITAGVDVQADRLESEAIGYGKDFESWGIEKRIFYGQTTLPEVWDALDKWLLSEFETVSGRKVKIASACIDSGFNTAAAYAFCKPRANRRIFCIKGHAGAGRPLVSRPTTNNAIGVRLFTVGVDTAKAIIVSHLKIQEQGAGYCHYPNAAGYDIEFFEQLTSEKEITIYKQGYPVQVWKKVRSNNEALDCRVYARAALEILNVNLNKPRRAQKGDDVAVQSTPDTTSKSKRAAFLDRATKQFQNSKQQQTSFVHGWKNR